MNPQIQKNYLYQCAQWQNMTDGQLWKLKVSLYFYERTRKLSVKLSFRHSCLFWLIYCPV